MTLNKNTKIFFASILFALVVTLANTNQVFAEETPAKIIEFAKEGASIAKQIDHLKSLPPTDLNTQKITKLSAQLNEIVVQVNKYGFMTHEQFEKSQTTSASPLASGANVSPSCTCPPSITFRSGFDWRYAGFWYGTTTGNWQTLTAGATQALSVANAGISNYDYGTPYTETYVSPAGHTASLYITTQVTNNGKLVKLYDSHTNIVTSTTSVKIYEPTSIQPGKAYDQYSVLGYLNYII